MNFSEAIERLQIMATATIDNYNDSVIEGLNPDDKISPDMDETETFKTFYEKEIDAYLVAIKSLKEWGMLSLNTECAKYVPKAKQELPERERIYADGWDDALEEVIRRVGKTILKIEKGAEDAKN